MFGPRRPGRGRPAAVTRAAVVVVGVMVLTLGLTNAARDRNPATDDALGAILLFSLLAGTVMIFPFSVSWVVSVRVRNVRPDLRVPILAPGLAVPGACLLAVAAGIAFVAIIHPQGFGPYLLVGLGFALVVGSVLVPDRR